MLAKLRTPDVRRLILSQEASPRLLEVLPPLSRQIATRWDRMYPLGDKPDYEPAPERSIEALAKAEGVTPQEYCYDYLVGAENRMVYFPVTNYVHGDLEVVRELIEDPHTILGLSDGGAHCGVICDASLNSSMLQHWVRDRTRGPRLGLEFVVKRMTSSTADFYGFKDRGRLQPGMKADVNVIDFDGLTLHSPKMIFDLPAGGRRLVQSVDGYDMTICSGTPIFEKGVGDRRASWQAGPLDGLTILNGARHSRAALFSCHPERSEGSNACQGVLWSIREVLRLRSGRRSYSFFGDQP